MNPISFESDYDIERSRLTTFFRLIIAIPWLIWVYIYGIGAQIVAIIAWFAMLFTGRYPEGMYSFVAGYLRLSTRVSAYAALLTDELPSFGAGPEPEYPVKVDVAPPQERYNRWKTFFKLVLYFPQALIVNVLAYVLIAAAFISWFRILFSGRKSITMHEALVVSIAYFVRSTGFLLLLTEAHPRMLEVQRFDPPADAPGLPPATAAPSPQVPEQAGGPPPPPQPPPPAQS
jgi:hypothetical protein